MRKFDIAPFALPNGPEGEYWFEESRDIEEVVVTFKERPPGKIALFYMQDKWPGVRVEERGDAEDPARFGWLGTDDWFNGSWRKASVQKTVGGRAVSLAFRGLKGDGLEETPDAYDVRFRRTMGLRIGVSDWSRVRRVEIYTRSISTVSTLRVELDAGRRTKGTSLSIKRHNAGLFSLEKMKGVAIVPVLVQSVHGSLQIKRLEKSETGNCLELRKGRNRSFEIVVEHMTPAHRYCGDDGQIQFSLEHDSFTISLEALEKEGPVWYAEEGLFIARAEDPTTFAEYRKRNAGKQTVNQRVAERVEQSFARAYFGQPRPHAEAYSFGCKHSPQRFWLEANGDLLLHRRNLTWLDRPGRSAGRFLSEGNVRFFFGLEGWIATGRGTDPAPVPVNNLHFKKGNLLLEQQSLCVPLERSILDGESGYDEATVALVRFRFENAGDKPLEARLPIRFSEDSRRSHNALGGGEQTDYLVPKSPLKSLAIRRGRITSRYRGKEVLRGVCETSMRSRVEGEAVLLRRSLQPGESCELLLKIPYVALESKGERAALKELDFDCCHREVTRFWREENGKGSQLCTPVPQLDALYAAHLSHVEFSDFSMPDAPDLINTSVGSSTYGNFSNESCMIVQELDQRGFHEDCRRRLDLWVKYQGTVEQPGNFADYEGMYYGAGGFESGNYNQHHGWVLWYMSEHFLLTRDRGWFGGVVDSVVEGADWVFRQRRETMKELPHSRGWERGFLPAGSLEDVTEFYYWLSTNCLTWRGVDAAARALEAFGHAEAKRVRREADAFRQDLIRGFETMRQHTPLVRLNDGRWVPHYPSRLYCRGRDQGWIREVLEGAVYLLISGLYDAGSKQAGWILDDFQDNLYLKPPYGYVLRDAEFNLFNRGGFSIQPCLLAGLLPHLDRDESEIYIWMFFNALAAVFREEINGLIEHPMPELGFSNSVTFKTSDEANAVMWLRYMLVYWNQGGVHFGRALPRAWFAEEGEIEITRVSTWFGEVGVRYAPDLERKRIGARVELGKLRDEPQVRVRFRHPQKASIKGVRVGGKGWTAFEGEDVDITGLSGTVEVEVRY